VFTIKRKYNTPHRDRIVKTRLSESEYAAFQERCKVSGLSQSEYLRKAITGAKVETVIRIGGVNREFLDSLNDTNREIVRVGTNLNQIAHHLNADGEMPTPLADEIHDCIGELTDLRFLLLQKAGDALGNDKAYRI